MALVPPPATAIMLKKKGIYGHPEEGNILKGFVCIKLKPISPRVAPFFCSLFLSYFGSSSKREHNCKQLAISCTGTYF
jgi:hypothetical protein